MALPDVSSDFQTFTFRIRPGIYFADDPAFGGKRRELTAHDYVYSYKRFYDPRTKSPMLFALENSKILGLSEARQRALKTKQPFAYDVAVDGLQALDRYTFRIRLATPNPRLPYDLAMSDVFGAVAREVVERYGDAIIEHPVGTGPFRLAEWRRSSRIVLERNPAYRDEVFDLTGPEEDATLKATLDTLRGRRLPMLDRVELDVIEESQPRWLSFLNAEHDLLWRLPLDYGNLAVPKGKLAPSLAKRGLQLDRMLDNSTTVTYFNIDHPVVGGYTPERVALRRAICLAVNIDEEIRIPRRNQAIPAQTPIAPHTYGYDANLKTEMSDFDPARAKALLDAFGYVDRDGDGWREQPDGSPLVLEMASRQDDLQRQLNELWERHMRAVGLRITHRYESDLAHSWVSGYRRHPFTHRFFHLVDVDPVAQAARH